MLVKDSKKIEKRFARPAVKKVQAHRGWMKKEEKEEEEARGKVTKKTEVWESRGTLPRLDKITLKIKATNG